MDSTRNPQYPLSTSTLEVHTGTNKPVNPSRCMVVCHHSIMAFHGIVFLYISPVEPQIKEQLEAAKDSEVGDVVSLIDGS